MIPPLLISVFVACIAFCIGYAIRRTGICAVAAAKQSVLHRKHVRSRAFAITACWAGSFLLPLAWLMPVTVELSPAYPVTLTVLVGGALFGLGACVNGACAFGTLGHLGGGNTNFLGTLFGAFVGAMMASLAGIGRQQMHVSPLSEFGILPVLAWLSFVVIATASYWLGVRRRRRLATTPGRRFGRLGAGVALLIIGVGGGSLYALAEGWTYMAFVSDHAARLVTPVGPGLGVVAVFGALATFAGAVFAALRAGRFRLTPLRAQSAGRKLVGGTLMGFAAIVIPGGNDVLLVYGIPSAAGHAIAAYAAMTAFLCSFFAVKARFKDHSSLFG